MHDKSGMDKSSAPPDYHTFLDEGCSRMLGGADSGGAAGLPEIKPGDSFLVQRPDDACCSVHGTETVVVDSPTPRTGRTVLLAEMP